MSVAGIILDKSYRTQLSVTPLHCVADMHVAPEKCHFFSSKNTLEVRQDAQNGHPARPQGVRRLRRTLGVRRRETHD